MSLRLIIEDDEGTTTVVPLGADAITIGRQQGNTIQLTEKNVSRRHARLFPEQEAWCIEDLGSYNGVKVNGSAVDARLTLKEGDVVQIGDYHLALTDNVDKSTLNFAAGQGAANDDGASGQVPVVASSSNDLPRLSTEDLAALQSGPQPVAAAPSMLDSGAMPASAAGGFEEEKKSNTGLLIGFGAVVVGALVLGIAWMARSGGDEPTKTQVASAGKNTEPKRPPTPEGKTMAGVADDAGAAAVPPPEPGVVDPPEPTPEAVPVADDPPPSDPPPEDAIEIADDTPSKPRRDSRPKKSKPKPPGSKPSTPPAPAVDTKALLADARKASLLKHRECYDLAKQAFNANKSTAASELMAKCACGMGDAAKAKKAASRLRGDKKDQAAKLCLKKGITL